MLQRDNADFVVFDFARRGTPFAHADDERDQLRFQNSWYLDDPAILIGTFNAANVATHTSRCAERQRAELKAMMQGKFITVLVDAGTVLSRRFVCFCVAFDGAVYFWRCVLLPLQRSPQLRKAFVHVCDELRGAGAVILACVSDNASNITNATMGDPLGDDADGALLGITFEPVGGEIDSTTADDAMLPTATVIEQVAADTPPRLYSRVNCWAHSLMLVLSDLLDSAKPLQNSAFRLLAQLASGVAALGATQKAQLRELLGTAFPRVHVPCTTIWNSHIRAAVIALQLFPALNQVLPSKFTDAQLVDIRVAVAVLVPLAWAIEGTANTVRS